MKPHIEYIIKLALRILTGAFKLSVVIMEEKQRTNDEYKKTIRQNNREIKNGVYKR